MKEKRDSGKLIVVRWNYREKPTPGQSDRPQIQVCKIYKNNFVNLQKQFVNLQL